MTRPLPNAQSLREAVRAVIEQPDGYPATRFVSATQDGNAPNLVDVCRNLINNREAVEYREKELKTFPYLLTIEDFVWRQGSLWGFDERTIEMARACAERYDQVAGYTRYTSAAREVAPPVISNRS